MIEVRKQLYEMCDKTSTSRTGMDHLVNYYIKSFISFKIKMYKYFNLSHSINWCAHLIIVNNFG